jgi:hypothetical protein
MTVHDRRLSFAKSSMPVREDPAAWRAAGAVQREAVDYVIEESD